MDDRAELLSLLDGCRAGGARAVEVMHQRFDRYVTSGMRVRPSRSTDERWTVRVWLEGGCAGQAQGPSRRGLAEAAVAQARAAPRSAVGGPADRFAPLTGPLGVDDRRWGQVEDADRNEMLGTTERALNMGGVQLRRLRYEELRERRSWMSTREVELSTAATTYTLEAEASLGALTLPGRISSRHFSNVASLPFGLDLRRRLEGLAKTVPRPTEPLPAVLEPRAMAAFVRSLAPAFVAAHVADTFVAPWLGKPLSAPVLHLTDDAGLASGLYAWPFDDRGVPPIAVPLLKEGVPGSLYHDPESARAAGLRPTGHVRAGAVRPSNLIVRPGSRTRNVILAELRDHLVVDELPAPDLRTGRIAGPVRLGVVRGGQRLGGAVASLDLPLAELLRRVEEVAADQERCEEVDAPTTVFAPLPFSD